MGLVLAAIAASAATVTDASAQAPAKTAPKKPDAKGQTAPAAAPATPAPAATTPAQTAPVEEKAPAEAAAASDKEDTRAIYISVDLAFTRADIGGISDNTGFDKTGANGLAAGLGIGYRHGDLRFGARFRDASTTEYSLWSLMGEIGYGLPFRPVSPVLFAHLGYMFDNGIERGAIAGSLPRGNVLTPNVDLDGLVVGGEIVASLWLTKFLRVGPFVGVDFTFLHRSQPALPQSIVPVGPETRNNALFGDSGSGVGYVLTLGVRGTGDIGF
ncbi:MAG: hypothetical protein JWP87_1719 [Labilithrix sp.]|jgi:hypothetical protein|nr:hypothetical protein [Labilithrix sp.]